MKIKAPKPKHKMSEFWGTVQSSFLEEDINKYNKYQEELLKRPYRQFIPKTNPLETQKGGTHYQNFTIQPVEFIHKNGLGFIVGNVIKYVCRFQSKNGVEDLEKAKHYIDLLIELNK